MATLPPLLSQTGLFEDARIVAYEPAFALYSDGAQKKRWIQIPAGTRIDTSDLDDWIFPVGTKVWKEFSLHGQPLETRFLVKTSEREWAGAAYMWSPGAHDAVLALDGANDIAGTEHDAPSASRCAGCHGGRRSYVLGFSAVQLGGRYAEMLTHAPTSPIAIPGNEVERATLGYLHTNCGHCHNQQRPAMSGPRCYDPQRSLDFWLPVSAHSARETPTYRSAIPKYLVPGDPEHSRLLRLVSRRGILLHMPPLATEHVDADGVALLGRWISSMPASR
jgi:hypothetical protein